MAVSGKWAAAACALCLGAFAAAPVYEVKAAFLFNFSKYVEWPEGAFGSPSVPITICVLGEGPIGELLDAAVRGKQVNGRDLAVRQIASVDGGANCQMIFVSASEQERLTAVFSRLGDQPVLIVSDAAAAAERGAVIGLVVEQNRVRFEVNLAAAHRSGLKLGSQLLKVAIRVIGRP